MCVELGLSIRSPFMHAKSSALVVQVTQFTHVPPLVNYTIINSLTAEDKPLKEDTINKIGAKSDKIHREGMRYLTGRLASERK